MAEESFGAQGTTKSVIFVGSCLWSVSKSVLLAIVSVVIKANRKEYITFALFDIGNEATIITNRLAPKVGLSGKRLRVKFGIFCRSEEIETTLGRVLARNFC